ncbi:hypothetical protein [uncultured Gammaproteobacteria bacterium]|nr:hypothetical protein [uncultured Gammaproteobacteria bacterium]CAC9982417.1 hypothetical protein [uncultured Gammaproteobacteria bacterium]VVH52049.1 hypothetical protein BPUTSESOX_592 [uncultured Gammaproteobacteria bacterium]
MFFSYSKLGKSNFDSLCFCPHIGFGKQLSVSKRAIMCQWT